MSDTDADPTDADPFRSIRDALEGERDHLEIHVADADPIDGVAQQVDDSFSNRGQVAAEQSENRQLAAQLRVQLDDVEFALRRLDEGSYGTCVTCGAPISDERLEAMPAARLCMVCAS